MHSQSEITQAILPYHVVRSNLSSREKALWAELSLRFGQAREVFADTTSLAQELQCGAATVRRAITGMLEKGFLKFLPKKVNKRHRAYLMAWDAAEVQPLEMTKSDVILSRARAHDEGESDILDPGLHRDDKFSTKTEAQDDKAQQELEAAIEQAEAQHEVESGTLDPDLRRDDKPRIEPGDWEKSPEHHSKEKRERMMQVGGDDFVAHLHGWHRLKSIGVPSDIAYSLARRYGVDACNYQIEHILMLAKTGMRPTVEMLQKFLEEKTPMPKAQPQVPEAALTPEQIREGELLMKEAREKLAERAFIEAYDAAIKAEKVLNRNAASRQLRDEIRSIYRESIDKEEEMMKQKRDAEPHAGA